MTPHPIDSHPTPVTNSAFAGSERDRPHDGTTGLDLIAVGVDGYAEGRDAACLARTIAGVSGAPDVLLVAVYADPVLALPSASKLGRTEAHKQAAEAALRELRDALVPSARTVVETDWSVPHALDRVVRREHRDLLVVGSSRDGPEGRVRIGPRTRQLLGAAQCALAVAPRGLCTQEPRLASIGVGYDGGPEAREALRRAGRLALAAGAKLRVRAIVDDRIPTAGWPQTFAGEVQWMWDEVIKPEVESLRKEAEGASSATGAESVVEAKSGCPPDELIALSQEVDLLVIGSRRWGAVERVLLGSTGEKVMHDAHCPVVLVPRPRASDAHRSDTGSGSESA